jgi:signal transduction histidine kinase
MSWRNGCWAAFSDWLEKQLKRVITVLSLRSPLAGSQGLEQAFSKIQHELHELVILGKVGFQCYFMVEGRRRPLHPVLRDEVYKIGREPLINTFRHSWIKSIDET